MAEVFEYELNSEVQEPLNANDPNDVFPMKPNCITSSEKQEEQDSKCPIGDVSRKGQMSACEALEMAKKEEKLGFSGEGGEKGSVKCALKIEVIDDTALIGPARVLGYMQESGRHGEMVGDGAHLERNANNERNLVQHCNGNGTRNAGSDGNGTRNPRNQNDKWNLMQESDRVHVFNGKRFVGSAGDLLKNENETEKPFMMQEGDGNGKGIVRFRGDMKRNGNDKNENVMQENEGNREKRPRRRGKKSDGKKESNEKEKLAFLDTVNMCAKGKMGYSRKEMETMRFVDVDEQNKKWAEIYCGLGPEIAKEYDGLVDSATQKQKHFHLDFDPRRQFGGDGHFSNVDNETRNANSLDHDMCLHTDDENSCSVAEEECCDNDESDEDYDGILKPAFLVTGEPDFDSGSPQDGLEYLRRVRWEASRIPSVKVSRVDKSKLNREQTAYMPKIPEIAKCPEHLLPLKHWEDAFLADFSELRLALSWHEGSANEVPGKQPTVLFSCEQETTDELSSSTLLVESFEESTAGEDSVESPDVSIRDNSNDQQTVSVISETDSLDTPDSTSGRQTVKENPGNYPTLCTILGMDSVARVSMLRKRISSLENAISVSKDDCIWLFALCAAVDTPLDADTCASFRSLLRKCANLRAQKVELDDEVIMVNILAAISGRYFGQLEN